MIQLEFELNIFKYILLSSQVGKKFVVVFNFFKS